MVAKTAALPVPPVMFAPRMMAAERKTVTDRTTVTEWKPPADRRRKGRAAPPARVAAAVRVPKTAPAELSTSAAV